MNEIVFKRKVYLKLELLAATSPIIMQAFLTTILTIFVVLPPLYLFDKIIVATVIFLICLGVSKKLLKYALLETPTYIKLSKKGFELAYILKKEFILLEDIYSYQIKVAGVLMSFRKDLYIIHKNGNLTIHEFYCPKFKEICILLKDLKKEPLPRLEICLNKTKLSERFIYIFLLFFFFGLLSKGLNGIFHAKEIISLFNFFIFLSVIAEHYYRKSAVIKLDSRGIQLVNLLNIQFIDFKEIQSIKQNKKFLNSSLEIYYNSKKINLYKRHYKEIDTFFEVYKSCFIKERTL